MSTSKLLNKLKSILSAEHKAQFQKYDSLKKVLKSLRKEKRRLKEELSDTNDVQQQQEIQTQLIIVSEQRKKGLKVLKHLKKKADA